MVKIKRKTIQEANLQQVIRPKISKRVSLQQIIRDSLIKYTNFNVQNNFSLKANSINRDVLQSYKTGPKQSKRPVFAVFSPKI